MTLIKFIRGAAAHSVAMLIAFGLSAAPAQAGYIVTLLQQGSNVVAIGSGSINLGALTPSCPTHCLTNAGVNPILGTISTGASTSPVNALPSLSYAGITGPTSFGSGGITFPNIGSGDNVAIDGSHEMLSVPLDYVSGSALSDSSTYYSQTFSSLGVTPGSYVWTWGGGATADSFTLDIGSVPEPSSALLFALGLLILARGVAPSAHRKRRAPAKSQHLVPKTWS